MATRKIFGIVNGPGRWDLALALFEGKEISLTLRHPESALDANLGKTPAVITGIEAKEETRQKWSLKGYVFCSDGGPSYKVQFVAEYDSTVRKGWFEFLAKEA